MVDCSTFWVRDMRDKFLIFMYILPNLRMCPIMIEALTPFNQTLRINMHENIARSRLLFGIAKRHIDLNKLPNSDFVHFYLRWSIICNHHDHYHQPMVVSQLKQEGRKQSPQLQKSLIQYKILSAILLSSVKYKNMNK